VKHVVVFPEDGMNLRSKADPNNWHIITEELERQIEAKGWKMHCFPDEVAGVDPKDRNTLAIYNGISSQYQPPIIERSLLVVNEPPIVKPRLYERLHGWPVRRVLTFVRKLVDNDRIFYNPFCVPSYTKDLSHIKRDKYACAITSNKSFPGGEYETRRNLYLKMGKKLHLYGYGWERDEEIMATVDYRGTCEDKIAKLAEYHCSIVIENQVIEGYCSEKYWHCRQAGTIPMPWIGWSPDYSLNDCTEESWARSIVAHLEAICD